MPKIDGQVSIEEEQKGDILVLKLNGRLDAITAPAAEAKIFDFIHKGHIKIVLDFQGVDHLSSCGMRMLLSVTKRLKSFSGKLLICALSAHVLDGLKIAGFEHFLEIAKTEEEALHKF